MSNFGAQYLPPLIEQHGLPIFETQAIPIEATLLEIDSYKAFLAARRAKIAEHLNAFVGTASAIT